MKKLTVTQKRKIAKLAVEKSECIENGALHVYLNGLAFEILINSEYRDAEHTHIISLNVCNENKPYSQAAFLRQIENNMNKLINWSEISRHITGGDRNCIRSNKIPKKHKKALDKLFAEDLPKWWFQKRNSQT